MFTIIAPTVLSALIILLVMLRSNHFTYCLFLSALTGVGSLFAINTLGSITGVTLGINDITLMVSSLGGMPGVIGLLTVRALLNYTIV